VRGDKGHRDKGVVDVGPRLRAGVIADDDVVIDEDGVEADLLGLLRGRDNSFGRRFEAEIIRIRAAG